MKIKKADFYEKNGSGITKETLIKEVIDFDNWPIQIIGVNDESLAICKNEQELREYLSS